VAKARIAVVSPFVDKRHGTERCLAEEIEWLARDYEIHLFSSRVEDTNLSGIAWHRVPEMPGPHLVKYLFWFAANHFWRWKESRRGGRPFDLIYSPGINCLDADVILVHHLFAEQLARVGEELRLQPERPWTWLRLIHRRLYYETLRALEKKVYSDRTVCLAAISRTMANDLVRGFRSGEQIPAIYYGVDVVRFDPAECRERRKAARNRFGFRPEEAVVLLIGNDWAKKGLNCLIEALAETRDLPVRALVVGRDARESYESRAAALGIAERLSFADVSADVIEFFAAADLYAAPSVYDPFGLPVLEAMACGLPVIASAAMGASELVTDAVNGRILHDPRDKTALSAMIRQLATDVTLRNRLGSKAAETARKFSWEANAEAIERLFVRALAND
jgi:UDP-glucose:(heptosyl)LPS alpha-1,3-glucosyltransferase